MPQAIAEKPLSPKQVADLLGRSPRWVCALIRRKKLRSITACRPYLIPLSEVNRLLK